MKEFFVKFILFLAIVMGCMIFLDKYYTSYVTNHKNVCEKSDWVLKHSNQTYDFAFIGNSRVINGIDITEVEKITDKSGINLGLTGANYAENYLLLNQFFKAGNKVKNLIVQIDMHSLKSSTLPYPFHNTNYMNLLNDSLVYSVYKDNTAFCRLLMWKYIPFSRYMEFSSRFVLYKILKGGYECKTSDVFDNSKGSELLKDKTFTPDPNSYSYWEIDKTDQKYLDKLVSCAKHNDIKVIFYTAPIYAKYFPYQLKLEQILEEEKTLATKQDIKYFDFSSKNTLCSELSNFNDNIHMNASGVKKFSVSIADSLKSILK